MNKRIKELAEQAAHATRKEHNNAYWRMQDEISEDATWREKFAELIVRECIGCCEQVISDPVLKSVDTWLNGGSQCISEIKQHFGVE